MSHLKERDLKNCLNCNAQVEGRYCHICGQENIETKESAWHLISHFFQDITHFDGKFFTTLKLLITRPGFVSAEYVRGRRASYLNPVRMYIFTSALFFLILFSVFHFGEVKFDDKDPFGGKSPEEIMKMDSTTYNNFSKTINNGKVLTKVEFKQMADSIQKESGIYLSSNNYKTKAAYDAALASGVQKDSWLQRQLTYKEIAINEKYGNNTKGFISAFINSLVHKFPQMLFISLPLFALWLKLLYRRHKQFYYVSHGIFSIHLYIFVFIAILIFIGIRSINENLNWGILNLASAMVAMGIFYYQYKGMRNFYKQSRTKTILKFFILNTLSLLMIVILFTVFILFSFMKI